MPLFLIVGGCFAAGACSGTVSKEGPGEEVEGVRDFIASAELVEVDRIRNFEKVTYRYVNDYFVTMPTRRKDYLIEFKSRCTELRRQKWSSDMIDFRVSARVLHADFDTIRGCKIDRIYELSDAQLAELQRLGDAPGEEVFLPEDSN